jgi:hypothetical protein
MTGRLALAVASALIVAGIALATTGCNFGDIIQTRTPREIQEQTGLPQKLTLNEATSEYQAWLEDTKRAAAEWKREIDDADAIAGMLRQITLNAWDQAGPTLAGVPVLGAALPGLGMLLTFAIGAGRTRKQKEASYNKGLEEGAKIAAKPQPPIDLNAR